MIDFAIVSLRNRRPNAFQLQQQVRVIRKIAVSDSTIRRRLNERGLVPLKLTYGAKLTAEPTPQLCT